MSRQVGWAVAASALAAVTAFVLHAGGDFALVGPSGVAQTTTTVAGAALVCLGGPQTPTRPGRRLVAAAGAGWLVAEWANPAAPGALAFTLGLIGCGSFLPFFLAGALPAAVGRLAFPRRAAVLVAFMGASLCGPISAVVTDPRESGCPDCAADLIAVTGVGSADSLARMAAAGAVVACLLAEAVVLWRPDRGSASRYPVMTLATVLACTAADGAVPAALGPGSGPGQATHTVAAVAVLGFAAVEAWAAWLARRTLRSVAHATLASSTAEHPPSVAEILREALGDPQLRVLYPAGDGWVDRSGSAVEAVGSGATLLTDGREVLAAVPGAPGQIRDAGVVAAALDRTRVQLDVERIQAGERSRVAEMRAARKQAAEAAYATRVRLERDLHDGAQQRLVALRFTLGLLRSISERLGAAAAVVAADQADAATQAALARLRELAHGMAGSSLQALGLVEALRGVAERSGASFQAEIPNDDGQARHLVSPLVGWIAYSLVADQLDSGRLRGPVEVVLRQDPFSLVVVVSDGPGDACVDAEPVDSGVVCGSLVPPMLADRVALVGGRFSIEGGGGAAGQRRELRVVLPCE